MENNEMAPATVNGYSRRTIVQGAAWSVPVIAAAIATPLAAASAGIPTLAFVNGPYTASACGTLGDVVLQATSDGTTPVTPGTLVTVTLPAGLTWSDGSSAPRVLPANGSGQVILTGLTASALGGAPTISASFPGADASAPVTVTAASSLAVAWDTNGSTANFPTVPANAIPVGASFYLAPNGNLYNGNTLVDTNVSSATGYFDGAYTINYVKNGGSFAWNSNGSTASYPNVPVDAVAVGASFFLAPNGDLYNGNTLVGQNVNSAIGYFNSGAYTVNYVTDDGGFAWNTNASTATYPNVPADAVAVGAEYFLTPSGDLYLQNSIVAQNVNSASGYFTNGAYAVNYVTDSGATAWNTNGSTASYPNVPIDAVAIGAEYFLAPNGDLYLQNSVIASNIPAAIGYFNSAYTINYIQNPAC